MKKSLLAVVLMVMAVINAYAFTVDGLNYSASGTVATLTGATSKSITKLTIPATVTYGGKTYTVDHISGNAFHNYTSLRELVIEDSDTRIASDQYTDSHGWSILGHPFEGCPLEKVYVGRNLAERIGDGSYRGDITPISSTAESMDLTIAGKSTFIMSGGLSGNLSFNGKNISNLTIGGNVVNVYKAAFKNCTLLKKVTFLPGSEPIDISPNEIFENCPIDTLEINRNIITDYLPTERRINTVKLSSDIDQFGFGIQALATNITNLIFEDSDKPLEIKDIVLYGSSIDSVYFGRYLSGTPSNIRYNTSFRHAEFGPKITSIEEYFVSTIKELESVKLSDNVTDIKNNAFYQTAIKEILLPETLVEIGKDAFNECKNLKIITLPNQLENIGSNAFRLTAIESISLPKSLKSIGSNAFSDCSELKKLTIKDSDEPLEINSNVLYGTSIDSIYFGRYLSGSDPSGIRYNTSFRHAEFGPKITSIEEYFVSTIKGLEYVKLSDNVTDIKNKAFYQTAIKDITLPNTLVEIGQAAFSECKSLNHITLPNRLENIRNDAFYLSAIQSISLPASLKSIGSEAFRGCSELKKLTIEDSDEPLEINSNVLYDTSLDSVYFGRYLSGSDPSGIRYNTSFRHAEFGPKITSIEEYFVSTIKGLEYVKLSDNVTDIKNKAFYQTAITEIKLPASLERIENSAFLECPLTNIKCAGTTPPVCADKDVFSAEAYENTVVTVSPGSKKTYRNTEVWKLFKNLQSEGGGFKVTVTYDDSLGKVTLNESTATSITVDEDEPLTVAITPSEGYKIAALTVNGADMLASLADNRLVYESIDANLDINVEFSLMTFAVTVPQSLAGGRIVINGADESPATVDYGSRLEITPVADRGHELSSLAVNGTDISSSLDENGSYVIDRVTSDIAIEAAFSPIVYTVKAVNATPYGTITLNGEAGDCRIEFVKPLVVGVTPRDEGCYLVSLTVDGIDVTAQSAGGSYTIESVEADMTVEAAFAIHTYTISLGFDPTMGSIVPDMPADAQSVTVEHGTTLSLAIIPAEGYETAAVTLDGRDVTDRLATDGTLTIENITADHSVEATFDVKRVILSVLGLEGGRLAMCYDYATEVTLLIEPEDGWTFHSLTVGDDTVTELDSDNSYTTRPLTDHTDVSVVFRRGAESGIGATDSDSDNITVYARSRTVTIEGARDGEPVEIYDASGIAVYRGTDHVINLSRQGVHIVCVAGQTFKVMLR